MKKQKKKGKSAIVIFGIVSFVILIVLYAVVLRNPGLGE